MSLFNFGKKKEEKKKAPACACSCGCHTGEVGKASKDCRAEAKDGICSIKVLGAGCKSCHEQYENAKEAVKAILLSNSKSKDAPSALLDVFKESADIEITDLVDEVRKELEEAMHSHEDARSSTLSELHTIANRANQEDVSNEKEPAKQTKSVF